MRTILIVEDDILEQDFLKDIIKEEVSKSDAIITCNNGPSAIKAAKEHRPDFIFMDIWLPKLDGIKALTAIREFCPNAAVIILSAYSDFSFAQEAIRLQVKDYLLKPIRPIEIRQTFQSVYLNSAASTSHFPQVLAPNIPIPKTSIHMDVIEKSVQYIQQNFKQKLSLKAVSDHVYMNPQYLSRIFKKEMGISCIEYINRLKIEYACKLLVTTDKSICQISSLCGFSEQSYFNRVFIHQMNTTPKLFRQKNGRTGSFEFLPTDL